MGGGTISILRMKSLMFFGRNMEQKIPVGSFLEVTGNKFFFFHIVIPGVVCILSRVRGS